MKEGDPKTGSEITAGNAVKTMLTFLIFVEVTSGFVQGYYSPLLPKIAEHVNVSSEAMGWFQTTQAIAAAVTVPLLSRLGDIYGPRKVLRGAILAVLAGTLLIALVPSYPIVLVGRVFIGPLGVWLPLAIALVYARTVGEGATRAISILSASLMGGIVVGTLAAGIADALLPNIVIVLLVPVVMVLGSAYAVFFKLPEGTDLAFARVDWVGFAGLAVMMVSFIIALAYVGPTHATASIIMFAVTIVVTAAWLWWEKRAESPAVDLNLVFSPGLGILYVIGFLLGIIMIDGAPALSDFLSHDPEMYSYGFGAGTGLIAEMITVMLLFATAGAFASSFIAAKFGMRRTLLVSAVVGAVGQAMQVPLYEQLTVFWFSGALTGLGLGVLIGALPALVAHSAPRDRTGIATGLYNSMVAMGGAVGGALFKLSLAAFRDADKMTHIGGYMTIWGIGALVFVLIALLVLRVRLPESAKK